MSRHGISSSAFLNRIQFLDAARCGNSEALRTLAALPGCPVLSRDRNGYTALYARLRLVEKLIVDWTCLEASDEISRSSTSLAQRLATDTAPQSRAMRTPFVSR